LLRKELTAAEVQAQTIRLAAARKKLNGEAPVTPVPDSDEAAETGNQVPRLAPATGGRGKKGVAQQIAERLGISKRAVRKRLRAASVAIDEKIDLDRDTPEELERKAEKRQHAEARVVRSKRRKPAPPVEDPTPPAEPYAGEIDSRVEALWKAFDAIGRTYQLRFVYYACIRLGLRPLRMAPRLEFQLAKDEPERF
jgi:hypothetical protein